MTNREIIEAAAVELACIVQGLNMHAEEWSADDLHKLNGEACRVVDLAGRIRYRLGLIQDGKE